MERIIVGVLSLLWLAGCASTPSDAMKTSSFGIDHMVIPAQAESGKDVAAYAGLSNRGDVDDRLLGIECECATSIELHHVVRNADMITMKNTLPLALPAKDRIEIKPPGKPFHFMLMGTTRAFAVGERVPMQLRFERAGSIDVEFTVVAKSQQGWDAWQPE